MRRMYPACRRLICPAVILLFLTFTGIASARQLDYLNIDVQMTLNWDTSIDVIEKQHVRMSGDWNGLYRYYQLAGCDNIEILEMS